MSNEFAIDAKISSAFWAALESLKSNLVTIFWDWTDSAPGEEIFYQTDTVQGDRKIWSPESPGNEFCDFLHDNMELLKKQGFIDSHRDQYRFIFDVSTRQIRVRVLDYLDPLLGCNNSIAF